MRDRSRVFTFLSVFVFSASLSAQVIDTTPPVITAQVTGTSNNGWYTSDVALHWDIVENESLISLQLGCNDDVIVTDMIGAVFNCTAISLGGSSFSSVTISRDTQAPGIQWFGNAPVYQVHQFVFITCNATDSTSGVASSTCGTTFSGAAYDFPVGANTLSATATDNAGNTGNSSVTFNVVVTYDGVKALVDRFVSRKNVALALKKKLDSASMYASKGDLARKQKQIVAFIDEVNRERGRTLSSPDADVLIRLAQLL
jgi:hypothetical protein